MDRNMYDGIYKLDYNNAKERQNINVFIMNRLELVATSANQSTENTPFPNSLIMQKLEWHISVSKKHQI